MQVNPYLNFNGRAEEALEFYSQAVGAKIGMVMRFAQLPPGVPTMGSLPPPEKIMHASFRVGDTVVFASDGECSARGEFKGVTLSLSVETDADGERLFDALAEGGKITMPMSETFFASRFGMLADKFGVPWMVIVEKPVAATSRADRPARKSAPAKKAAKRG